MVLRQAIDSIIADDPADQTWAFLDDVRLAGSRVWTSSTTSARRLDADIRIGLSTDSSRG